MIRELDLDQAKVNPNGSGISLGHPVGATGAIITIKAIHELHRIGGRYALVTMCKNGRKRATSRAAMRWNAGCSPSPLLSSRIPGQVAERDAEVDLARVYK